MRLAQHLAVGNVGGAAFAPGGAKIRVVGHKLRFSWHLRLNSAGLAGQKKGMDFSNPCPGALGSLVNR